MITCNCPFLCHTAVPTNQTPCIITVEHEYQRSGSLNTVTLYPMFNITNLCLFISCFLWSTSSHQLKWLILETNATFKANHCFRSIAVLNSTTFTISYDWCWIAHTLFQTAGTHSWLNIGSQWSPVIITQEVSDEFVIQCVWLGTSQWRLVSSQNMFRSYVWLHTNIPANKYNN